MSADINIHPAPSTMAREALPWDDNADAREKVLRNEARAHYAAGVAAERARLHAILRDLDKGDWLTGRLRDLVASLDK